MRQRLEAWRAIGASPTLLRWIREGVRIPFLGRPPAPFHQGVSFGDVTPTQFEFLAKELSRFTSEGAFEPGPRARWVSRAFLVPKPPKPDGSPSWRIVVDLRHLNSFCRTMNLQLETLKRLRYLARRGDFMISFDLADGYYACGVAAEDRDYFTFEIPQALAQAAGLPGTVVRLCGLPMGWSLSPYYFVKLMEPVVRYLRSPQCFRQQEPRRVTRRQLRHQRWRGVRMLPFMDDYLFMCSTYQDALRLRDRLDGLLDSLGLARNPKKGQWEPVQVLQHLRLLVDTKRGEFRAPAEKLDRIARQAHELLCASARRKRAIPVRELSKLAGRCQFLYLAIPPARFYLRELHSVIATKSSWGGCVKVTKQLKRDLEWWRQVPAQHNGRSIFREVETAYLHVDSSSFGWGAVVNEHLEARGFWHEPVRSQHITYKELRAVRLAVESFLPQLRGRCVRVHEDNQAVVSILTHLTSRSPDLMAELRKLWYLLDCNDIQLRPRYLRSAANVWADRLSRELDDADWTLNPRIFRYLDRQFGHTVDRFASMENAQLPRYNSRWLDPRTEAVDSLRLSDEAWRAESNWCNPPWELLDDLVLKLQRSGAAATVG